MKFCYAMRLTRAGQWPDREGGRVAKANALPHGRATAPMSQSGEHES